MLRPLLQLYCAHAESLVCDRPKVSCSEARVRHAISNVYAAWAAAAAYGVLSPAGVLGVAANVTMHCQGRCNSSQAWKKV